MRDLFNALDTWHGSGRDAAIARVVDLDGSGPRLPGAAMAVNLDQDVRGSVSGGCVEGAVVIEALDVIEADAHRVVTFGYSDDEAFAVGLTCGGTIHLFLERFEPGDWYGPLKADIAAERAVALATVIDGPGVGNKLLVRADDTVIGTLGTEGLDRVAERDARGELAAGRSGLRHYGEHGEAREDVVAVFIESFAPPPQMLIFGAVDFTAALAKVAKVLGYRVTVCDAREVFATRQRFPMADELVVDWPDRLLAEVGDDLGPRDAVCILTHDAKFDVPAVTASLDTKVGYIGVMGSRRTHDDRTSRLVEAGVDQAGLDRLRSPIGLDLGARTPEETAVSIVAEIIAERTGRSVASSPAPRVRSTIESARRGWWSHRSLWCLTNVEALTLVEVGAVVDRQLPRVGAPGGDRERREGDRQRHRQGRTRLKARRSAGFEWPCTTSGCSLIITGCPSSSRRSRRHRVACWRGPRGPRYGWRPPSVGAVVR